VSAGSELGPEKGILAKRRSFVDADRLTPATKVRFAPVSFGTGASSTPPALSIVANAAAGAMCRRIEDRFEIVDAPGPDVLEIRLRLTDVRETNAVAAATSAVLPIRAPLGLGALGVEAEVIAETPDGPRPAAAMIWARRADPVFSSARPSRVGDAYNFAQDFGRSFGGMIVKAAGKGEKRKDDDRGSPCDRFGKPRLSAALLETVGVSLPPSIADRPPAKASESAQ